MTATARQKIEGLTNSWYGYAVFGAPLSLWNEGIGFFSLIGDGRVVPLLGLPDVVHRPPSAREVVAHALRPDRCSPAS